MLNKKDRIFKNLTGEKSWHIEEAQKRGDWKNIEKILATEKTKLIEQLKKTGLRGRGGASSYTGEKFSRIKHDADKPVYMIVNAAESEPGTCKDRFILANEPHKVLEGAVVASYMIGASTCYIYVRGKYFNEVDILQEAIEEAEKAGFIGKNICGSGFDLNVFIHKGAGAYICGEETAIIESIEGNRGEPRIKPPYPYEKGLYSCPTLISNVETVAVIPTVLKKKADWFRTLGKHSDSGCRIFTVLGHVENPCIVEEEMGVPLKYLIENYAGGVTGGWSNLLAVFPGGASSSILPAEQCEFALMDNDALEKLDTKLGTASVIVLNKKADIIQTVGRLTEFYEKECCGKCISCRQGLKLLSKAMNSLMQNKASEEDMEILKRVPEKMVTGVLCPLANTASRPVKSLMKYFMEETVKTESKEEYTETVENGEEREND